MKDSRGKDSKTLTFVTLAFTVLFIKFLAAGVTVGDSFSVAEMSAEAFGLAFTAILAPWIAREWKDKS